ncbi:hypothetical protein GCM10022403_056860 [Streptomyces coacervatus]|uniref:Uncharacterized protein n=1 Tax=Streptomyces coacervatus TaxID=647381 RepID=A0ABP7IDN6_9ACTN
MEVSANVGTTHRVTTQPTTVSVGAKGAEGRCPGSPETEATAGAATPHRRGPGRRAVGPRGGPYFLQRRECGFCHTPGTACPVVGWVEVVRTWTSSGFRS